MCARRLVQIVNSAASKSPIQSILLAAGLPGLFVVWRRGPTEGWALIGFCAAGLFWGYLAGALRALDFLQPGRHTYACYSALAVAGGAGLDELRPATPRRSPRSGPPRSMGHGRSRP